MFKIIASFISFIYLINFIIVLNKYPKYILLFPLTLYLTPFLNLLPSAFGFTVPLLLEYIGFIIFVAIITLKRINIIEIFHRKNILSLYSLFVVLILSHVFLGTRLRISLMDNLFPPILHLSIICFCLLISYPYIKDDPWIVINWFRIIIIINIFFGASILFYRYFSGDYSWHENLKVANIGYNINQYAIIVIIGLLVQLCKGNEIQKQNYFLIASFVFLNILAFSRGGFIALVFLMMIFVIMSYKLNITILLAVVITFFLNLSVSRFFFDRFSEITDQGMTSSVRWKYLLRGLYLIRDHPISGIGVGNFYLYRYTYPDVSTGSYNDSHNVFIQIGAETGIMGLILIMLFFYFSYKYIKKLKEKYLNLYILGVCLLVLFIISGQFNHDKYNFFLYLPILYLSWVGYNENKILSNSSLIDK